MLRIRLPWLLLLILPAHVMGADAPSIPPIQRTGNPWNAGTRQSPPQPATPLAPLNLTIYQGFDNHRPGSGTGDRPLAVDVTSVMAQCADGSVIVTALVIGGQLRPLDNRCPRDPTPPRTAPAGARPSSPAPPCDADSWNCSTGPVAR
jgi:hypothetical protein